MKTLNIIWHSLVPFIVSFAVWYLVGSFMCVSLNPVDWTLNDREFTVLMGAIWGAALYYKLKERSYE
jgi:nitrate/nitrite transporter NarK